MDNNITDSGSRVTRSLRKRLTSVDSDNSSRPGTPVQSKLSSISEISVSPSRSTRTTRLSTTGISTPVKTPAKRIATSSTIIKENIEVVTPVRRSTRRHSASVNENDETSQSALKLPPFGTSAEGRVLTDESEVAIRITRSKSKSPQQIKINNTPDSIQTKILVLNKNSENIEDQNVKSDSQKRRKPGPKSKTRKLEELENTSDVEVYENTMEKHSDFILKNVEFEEHRIVNQNTDMTKINSNTVKECINKQNDNADGCKIDYSKESNSSYDRNQNISTCGYEKHGSEIEGATNDSNNELKTDDNEIRENETNVSVSKVVESENNVNIYNVDKNENDEINCWKQDKQRKPSAIEDKITCISTLAPYQNVENVESNKICYDTKKVDFVSSPASDMSIKTVYPKTPASMKAKQNFIEKLSARDRESFINEVNAEASNVDKQEVTVNDYKEVTDEHVLSLNSGAMMTPIKHASKSVQSFKVVESSGSICSETSKYDGEIPVKVEEVGKEEEKEGNLICDTVTTELMSNEKNYSINNELEKNEVEIKWIIPSVRGTIDKGSKLNAVVTEKDTYAGKISNNNDESKDVEINKKKAFSSEDEDEKSNYEESDEERKLHPIEDSYTRKHDFNDDEAMEVEAYESGDSLDSKERQEIIENKIPCDGESIGSCTTEDDHDEYADEENSENVDSFIVSDNEDLVCVESCDDDEDLEEHNVKKKKIYKRLQRPIDNSSSTEEEEVYVNQPYDNLKLTCSDSDNENNNSLSNKQNNTEYDKETYKILQHSGENSISLDLIEKEYGNKDQIKRNFEEIKSDFNNGNCLTEKLNSLSNSGEDVVLDSSKLSDSALRLHCGDENESEEKNVDKENVDIRRKEIIRKLNQSDRLNKSVRDLTLECDTSPIENKLISNRVMADIIKEGGNVGSMLSSDESVNKKQFESHLGEVSVTTESDNEKENDLKPGKDDNELTLSPGCNKRDKDEFNERKEWQRSFGTTITEVKSKDNNSLLTSPSSDNRDIGEIKNDNIKNLENIRHMSLPLGNPLVRTRRQSLALPTNPDMEICSSSRNGGTNKIATRKSLGIISNNDFNPSQSFIDSIELYKSELNRQGVKRKRLSKSFCGASETHDNSIIDIDVRHLHKRSKFIGEISMEESHHDSTENMNTTTLLPRISSTPCGEASKSLSKNNIERILSRCDEILEAANRAKLEAKINCKKSKAKLSKKHKKSLSNTSHERDQNDVLRKVCKEIKRIDKTKVAVTQAIRAADNIISKNKQTQYKKEDGGGTLKSKILTQNVLEVIKEPVTIKRKKRKETHSNVGNNDQNYQTTSTAAGNFVELPQTPEKRKKKTYIKLATGKVSVEPVTPKKRSVLACNGMEFRESPITPDAVGFKVREILLAEKNSALSFLSDGKRKRKNCDKSLKKGTLPIPQWTQSGLFVEEKINTIHGIKRAEENRMSERSEKTKTNTAEIKQNAIWNFKQSAVMRPEIKRCTKRNIQQLKERRQDLY